MPYSNQQGCIQYDCCTEISYTCVRARALGIVGRTCSKKAQRRCETHHTTASIVLTHPAQKKPHPNEPRKACVLGGADGRRHYEVVGQQGEHVHDQPAARVVGHNGPALTHQLAVLVWVRSAAHVCGRKQGAGGQRHIAICVASWPTLVPALLPASCTFTTAGAIMVL